MGAGRLGIQLDEVEEVSLFFCCSPRWSCWKRRGRLGVDVPGKGSQLGLDEVGVSEGLKQG